MDIGGKRILSIILVFFIGLVTFSVGYLVRDFDILPISLQKNECGVLASDRAFFEVLDELMENHYTQPEREDLIVGAIDGMISSLDDPYTSYFDLEEAEAYQSNFGETYVGIGVTVKYKENLIVIEQVKKDGPAYNSGLKVNDVITHVDGVELFGLSFYEAIGMVTGEPDTQVIVGVYRAGYPETLYFPMTRALIDNSSVEYSSYQQDGENIGYIKVNTFGDETFPLFNDAVVDLENQGIDSLIIDLRDNGGGHLLTVYYMMNVFLTEQDGPMFGTEYYSNGVHYLKEYVASNTIKKDYNIVTLINENSASASEVFASGMQEQGGYTLVGTTSFGKGTMQSDKLISATVGDQLHITIGKWTTADGGWVHYLGGTDGVTPDVVVEETDYEKAYKVFLLNEPPILQDVVDNRVANIQVILNLMGYNVRTDGYFDMATKNAVESIQTNNSLTVDGALNEETLTFINSQLDEFNNDYKNDSQLQAAIDYLVENPDVN